MFLDSSACFSEESLSLITSQNNVNLKNNLIKQFKSKFPALEPDYQSKMMYMFLKSSSKQNNKNTSSYNCIIGIYSQLSSTNIINNECKYFMENYRNAIESEKNYLKLQKFNRQDSILVQYYDISKKGKNNSEISFDCNFEKEGIVMTDLGSGGNSADNTKHSFKYDQMNSCNPLSPSKAKSTIEPKSLANKYKNDDACLGMRVKWQSESHYNLICSLQEKEENFKIEKKLMAATMYQKCFSEGMESIVKTLKSNNDSLENLDNNKLDKYTKNKFLEILIDIRDKDYENFVVKNSNFQRILLLLKNKIDIYIKQLLSSLLKDFGINSDGSITDNQINNNENNNINTQDCEENINCSNSLNFNTESQEYDIDLQNNIRNLSFEYNLIPKQQINNSGTISPDEKYKYESLQPKNNKQDLSSEYVNYFKNLIKDIKPNITEEELNNAVKFITKYPNFLEDLKSKNIPITKDMVDNMINNEFNKVFNLINSFSNNEKPLNYNNNYTLNNTGKSNSNSSTDYSKDENEWDEDQNQDINPPIITMPTRNFELLKDHKNKNDLVLEPNYPEDYYSDVSSLTNNQQPKSYVNNEDQKKNNFNKQVITKPLKEDCNCKKKKNVSPPNINVWPKSKSNIDQSKESKQEFKNNLLDNNNYLKPNVQLSNEQLVENNDYLEIYTTATRYEGNLNVPEVSSTHQKHVLSKEDSINYIKKLYIINQLLETDTLALEFYNSLKNRLNN